LKVLGRNVVLLEWVASVNAWLPYACSRSVTLNVNSDLIETSITGSANARTFEHECYTFDGSLEGILNLYKANHLLLQDARYKQINGVKTLMRFERDDLDGHIYTDEAYFLFTNTSDISAFDNVSTFTFRIQGTGQLTQIYTPSPKVNAIVYSLYYNSDGSGETSFQDDRLIGVNVIGAWRQSDYEVILSGTPTQNEVKHDSGTGTMSWTVPMDGGNPGDPENYPPERWHIQYQIIYEGS
jgi:hypothetical protein